MIENDKLLRELIEDCSPETAQRFFRRKNNALERMSEPLGNPDPERFANLIKLGRLKFDTDNILFIFAEVDTEITERSCRKAQFDATRKILKQEIADAGIFIFRGQNGAFRLSLVYTLYEGAKARFNHYRRFTFFVEPDSERNTTFKRQLGRCDFESLAAIKDSFSVEAVSKDFFQELSN